MVSKKDNLLVARNNRYYFGITDMTDGNVYAWALPADDVIAYAADHDLYDAGDAAEEMAAAMPVAEMRYVPGIMHGRQQEDIIDWMYPHLMVGELTTY